ncbi:hypothetical protein M426DRAFT_25930 [Hypoxylon sp. CI-4A]|nr:hypothetical protein M426DRAFT_25930 [Hypoxylon sp. CI-4A]
MYFSTSVIATLLAASDLATAIPALALDGTFTEHQVRHTNGSDVNVYLRNSYVDMNSDVYKHEKRFYKTYHNDTSKFEICAETNFVDTSTLDSALTSDCSAIMTELRANPGYFDTGDYTNNEFNCLAVCGTCAFGVRRTDGLSSQVNVGSKDVVDNLNSAVIRFPLEGHVGATGNFTCNSAPINWAIMKATES